MGTLNRQELPVSTVVLGIGDNFYNRLSNLMSSSLRIDY